jgi:hypothetical protein
LDIVLFDEQLNAPLSLVGDIGVFPIECVYATIEVKSVLNSTTLDQAARSIGQIRQYKTSKQYTASVLDISSGTISMLPAKEGLNIALAPRAYIFAFRTSWSLDRLTAELKDAAAEYGAYFHGVVILSKEWFLYQLQKKKSRPMRFVAKQGTTVNEFALKLSRDTIRYPMLPANMEPYFRGDGEDS